MTEHPGQPTANYKLVKLANGAWSIHSRVVGETCHPSVGPIAEANVLYVQQLHLRERLQSHQGEFVIWDVGLGAAANALAVIKASRDLPCAIRLISFEFTLEPLLFGLEHAEKLGYFEQYREHVQKLITEKKVSFQDGSQSVNWELHLGNFPTLLTQPIAAILPKPHTILFDPFSPLKNPEMWTAPLFSNLWRLLDPQRPCVLPTYSRSTMLRVALLLAGFFVGVGRATGFKEETTIAANSLSLLDLPLGHTWLQRARRSNSAEPLWDPVYRQAPLSPSSWEKLSRHPQFASSKQPQ